LADVGGVFGVEDGTARGAGGLRVPNLEQRAAAHGIGVDWDLGWDD
jgi:hypothetical protein